MLSPIIISQEISAVKKNFPYNEYIAWEIFIFLHCIYLLRISALLSFSLHRAQAACMSASYAHIHCVALCSLFQ